MNAVEELIEAARKHPLYQNVLKTKGKIVIGRGKKSSPDFLFIGEAPGQNENKEGKPFIGRSGKILDHWIKETGIDSYTVINAVPIIPLDEKGKIRPPTKDEVEYFRPYTKSLIKQINPKYIILMGKSSAKFLEEEKNFKNAGWNSNIGYIYHPSFFMKNGRKGIADFKRLVLQKPKNRKTVKTEFRLNKQKADNLGHKEMISGILAMAHKYCKESKLFFKDINQKDICMIGGQRAKIFTRDALSDNDMLIPEEWYQKNKDINLFILCKIKGGFCEFVGHTTKEIVVNTRLVSMIGTDSDTASKQMRRIFAEQYLPMTDIFQIQEEQKEKVEKIVPQNYVPLHCHSEFSIGDGCVHLKNYAKAMYKKGFKGGALTDHGTLAGVWDFQKGMLEQNIKPVLGNEFYVKIPELEKQRCHLVVLVKNKQGWKNILKLQSIAVRDHFYYKPVLPIEDLFNNSEGLIVSAACLIGVIQKLLLEGEGVIAEKYIKKFKEVFGEDYYGEIQIHDILGNQAIMQQSYYLHTKYGIKCIFSTDAHYMDQDHKKYHDAVKAISMKKEYKDSGFNDDCFYLMTDEDIEKRINNNPETHWMKELIHEFKKNTFEILDKIEDDIIEIPTELDTLPKLLGSKEERKAKLKELCIKGLEEHTPYTYEGKYKERLDLEMNRILKKGYENYFLMVYEMIKWAKQNGIFCGPCRGSVGSSLVSYSLNITTVDPMKFNLLFDRFMSDIRRDMPDIDMDFQDIRRPEIFQYLRDTYGANHCAKVATYSRFHPKGVLRDIGRIFKIPIGEIEKICSLVIERCVDGGTLVDTLEEGKKQKGQTTIKRLFEDFKSGKLNKKVRVYNTSNQKDYFSEIAEVFENGKNEVFEIETENGQKIICTGSHKFLTRNGWKELRNIEEEEEILVTGTTETKHSKCDNCGSDLFSKYSKKFCSKECYYEHKIKNKEKYSMKLVSNFCKQCGIEFKTKRWRKRIFCSLSCTTKYKNLYNNPMKNIETIKKMISKKKGCKVWNKGLTVSDERVLKNVQKSRKSCAKHKGQCEIKLSKIVQKYTTEIVEFEYYCKPFFLDVAIPKLKINFEYDGVYWHKNTKSIDADRDELLNKKKWKVIRLCESLGWKKIEEIVKNEMAKN